MWYGIGIIGLIIWVAIAFWPARVAARKGHSFIGYFCLSLLFFPLSLIMAYMVADRRMAPSGLIDLAVRAAVTLMQVASCVVSVLMASISMIVPPRRAQIAALVVTAGVTSSVVIQDHTDDHLAQAEDDPAAQPWPLRGVVAVGAQEAEGPDEHSGDSENGQRRVGRDGALDQEAGEPDDRGRDAYTAGDQAKS